MIKLGIEAPTIVAPGKSYLARLTLTNQSTKAGVPVEVMLGVGISSFADSRTLIPEQVTSEYFGPDEIRSFDYPLNIPPDTAGLSGTINAWVEDPAGNRITLASEEIKIMECTPGDAECVGTDLYVCSSVGRWELAEVDSLQCMTELQKVLKQIEAGTWTATVAQLDAIADWPTGDYQAVIDAAYGYAASEAAAEKAATGEAHYVWWSAVGGFSTVSASEVGMSTEVLLAAEGKIEEAIEAGFSASYSQLEDLESLVGMGDTYEAAIDGAYEAAASEAASQETATGEDYYVSWSADEGYSTVSASEVYSDPGDWIW